MLIHEIKDSDVCLTLFEFLMENGSDQILIFLRRDSIELLQGLNDCSRVVRHFVNLITID